MRSGGPAGKRHRKFFKSTKKAAAWAQIENAALIKPGTNVLEMSERLRVNAFQAQEIVAPFGRSIVDAAKFAARHWLRASQSETVQCAVNKMISAKQKDKKRDRYLSDLKSRLNRFCASLGERTISDVGAVEVRQWLADLPGSPTTRNKMRRILSVLWSFATDNGWCEGNIIDKIKASATDPQKIGILTPLEAAKLLFHAPAWREPFLLSAFSAGSGARN